MSRSAATLDGLAQDLRQRLRASRVTVRLHPERNLPIVAEALAPGVPSMRAERAIDQNAAATVRWVAEHRRTLAVRDARRDEPATPRAMLDTFGLRAFMIAPILAGPRLEGTVSVHINEDVRNWTPEDIAAVDATRDEIARLMPDKS